MKVYKNIRTDSSTRRIVDNFLVVNDEIIFINIGRLIEKTLVGYNLVL